MMSMMISTGARADVLQEQVRTPTSPSPVANRDPLAPAAFIKLPIGAITPKGWLRTQLELQRDGFIGRLDELSRFIRLDSGWLQPDNEGWEEAPYWLKGYVDTACVLKDPDMIAEARRWIDACLDSQQDDGYFGPQSLKRGRDWWSHMVVLYVFRSFHEATGDERIIPAMLRFFRFLEQRPEEDLIPYKWGEGPYRKEWWQSVRSGDLMQSLYWTYNRTGETWLLDLARRVHERSADWVGGIPTWHGVNICQGFREPAVFSQQSKDVAHLQATYRNYATVWGEYGQVPGGMFGADENCRKGFTGPRQAAETCSMVEFMNSCQEIIRIDGLSTWGDRCEDVAFNSLPASMTADLRGLHYLTAPNMVQLDRHNKAPGIENGGEMLSFNPWSYRCCQHNAGQGWPYYAEHLWMMTPDGGLAFVLVAPCEVTARVGDGALTGGGAVATVLVETEYPFDENLSLRVRLSKPATFPLLLRKPDWCGQPGVTVNGAEISPPATKGGFLRIEREWRDGDVVHVGFPMEVAVRRWDAHGGCVSIHRGPLTYSLRIEEEWRAYAGTPRWPAFEVFPKTPWNYGLMLDADNPASSITVVRRTGLLPRQPFVLDGSPVVLEAKARRIPEWTLDRRGLITEVQPSPAKVAPGEPETVTLIPMGAARLRISAFPTVTTDSAGHVWKAPPPSRHTASFESPVDDIAAVSDGRIPKNSNDHDVPRFTFWDHKGTTEWVTYDFEAIRRVSATRVYWFDDEPKGGGCRVPAGWEVQYKKGDDWLPVQLTGGSTYAVDKDRFCDVMFQDVETTALRLLIRLQPGFSAGLLEWEIAGDRIPAPK